MNVETMLAMLKVDLGISTDAYDERLRQYLSAASDYIEREGIHLNESSLSDSNLQVMYAAYLWRKRDTGQGMPRMLRWHLNNRLFSEKVKSNG